jgi:NH3-dependent NAD+ synthetase
MVVVLGLSGGEDSAGFAIEAIDVGRPDGEADHLVVAEALLSRGA